MHVYTMHTCMYACVSRQASLFFPDVFSLPPSFLPASLPQPVPTTYLTDFKKAYLTFQHQRVYDPERECLVTLKPLPPGLQVCVVWGLGACDMCRYADISICMCDMYVCLHTCTYPPPHTHAHTQTEDMPYIGTDLSQEVAQAISSGRMHPCTRQYWEDVVDAASTAASSSAPLKLVPQDRSQGGGGGGVGAKVVLSVSLTHCLSVLLSLSLCPSSAYVCMYVCLDVCVCMYLSIYTFIDLCIHLCIYLCTQRTHMHGRANCQLTREDVHMLQM